MSAFLSIARNTLLECVRQPIYFIITMLCALAIVFTTWSAGFSMGYSDSAEVSGDNKMLLDLALATVFVCGMLLSAFLSTAVISREIENKTVLTVVSKPVSRPVLVLGKFSGVATAIVVAVGTMLLFVQLAVRHQVLSTAADTVDGPVLAFAGVAFLLAIGLGVWGNFFYGWSFSQTTTLALFPLMLAAWVGVLAVDKKWQFQSLADDFKPQIALASICLLLAQLVLTSIATAASARLGQVMTLVVCIGVFVLGLMANHLFGRRAVDNHFVARILSAEPQLVGHASFDTTGDVYNIKLEYAPRSRIATGSYFYYGPNPNGLMLKVPTFAAEQGASATIWPGDANDMAAKADRSKPAGLVVTASEGVNLTVERVGSESPLGLVPPAKNDFVFLRPTRTNPFFLGLWMLTPNVQSFWLNDAVTQNQPIPPSHVGLVAIYAAALVGGFLSLAVVLFQTREVG